jgi:hypothetical protein
LKEIYQPLHTFYRVCKDHSSSSSSRLDRIYVSHEEVDLALNPANTAYVFLPNSIISKSLVNTTDNQITVAYPAIVVSDHIAVRLTSDKGPPTFKRSRRIQRWLAEDPRFIALFNELLPHYTFPNKTAFAHHDAFVEAAFAAKKAYYLDRAETKEEELTRLSKFGICLQALRLISRVSPDAVALATLVNAHPFLLSLVQKIDQGSEAKELREYANELITQDALECSNRTCENSLARGTSTSPPNVPLPSQVCSLQNLKAILPSDRARLCGLRRNMSEEISSDPQVMAEIAEDFWKKFGLRGIKHPRQPRII